MPVKGPIVLGMASQFLAKRRIVFAPMPTPFTIRRSLDIISAPLPCFLKSPGFDLEHATGLLSGSNVRDFGNIFMQREPLSCPRCRQAGVRLRRQSAELPMLIVDDVAVVLAATAW